MALTISQRIDAIKQIAERLRTESWAIIDLTLKQIGAPEIDWSGSNEIAYIIARINDLSDGTLTELGQHLGFEFQNNGASNIEPSFWHKDFFRVFVSHLATEKKWAAELQTSLLRYGITSFVAHNDIVPTEEWQNQIELALFTCDALVALLHDKFHDSNWTDQEIGFAMGRAVPVFAVRLGQTPYGFIGRFQAFNGMGLSPAKLAEDLFETYIKNKQTKQRMSAALVNFFE